ncbi:uncharacterized protein G2W53_001026 [Senna tora]|uniref:Uncharacterized protein n=1 Tax=Senna tora TaxID=362788 RepID=A0A835CI91_9FABA|nr:uncharacterized protein G2W53_001026 [Senna tora]
MESHTPADASVKPTEIRQQLASITIQMNSLNERVDRIFNFMEKSNGKTDDPWTSVPVAKEARAKRGKVTFQLSRDHTVNFFYLEDEEDPIDEERYNPVVKANGVEVKKEEVDANIAQGQGMTKSCRLYVSNVPIDKPEASGEKDATGPNSGGISTCIRPYFGIEHHGIGYNWRLKSNLGVEQILHISETIISTDGGRKSGTVAVVKEGFSSRSFPLIHRSGVREPLASCEAKLIPSVFSHK